MNPLLRYTLGRLGLFLLVLVVLYPVPGLDLLLKLLLALVISFPLSWFLLRGPRDEASVRLARRFERRKQEKEKLRAALAGEDEPADEDGPDRRAGSGPSS